MEYITLGVVFLLETSDIEKNIIRFKGLVDDLTVMFEVCQTVH